MTSHYHEAVLVATDLYITDGRKDMFCGHYLT